MNDLEEPLLPSNEYSFEEKRVHHFCKDSALYHGRGVHQIHGAAHIIKQCPVSSLKIRWKKIGMFTVLLLLLFNVILILCWSPHDYTKKNYPSQSHLSDVFMHILVNGDNEVNFNEQLTYIELLSKKYLDYRYNFIVLFNDSTSEASHIFAEYNNEVALNSLWSRKYQHRKPEYINNVRIRYMSLSEYFADSPLNADWKFLPQKFIEFLVRAVSLWDNGGIAFNHKMLSQELSHSMYRGNVEYVLKNYKKCNKKNSLYNKVKQNLKEKFVVNNIQDIIRRLENKDDYIESSQYNPTEAEEKVFSTIEIKGIPNTVPVEINKIPPSESNFMSLNGIDNFQRMDTKSIISFIKRADPKNLNNINFNNKQKPRSKIITTKYDSDDIKTSKNEFAYNCETNQLTIDLNGNILATRTPCHAFLGDLFNDVFYYMGDENINSFISTELSKFCKSDSSKCEVLS